MWSSKSDIILLGVIELRGHRFLLALLKLRLRFELSKGLVVKLINLFLIIFRVKLILKISLVFLFIVFFNPPLRKDFFHQSHFLIHIF